MDKFYTKSRETGYVHLWPSNFFIEPDGSTVEHEYQAAKTDDLVWKARILLASTASEAKQLGRRAPLRADWEEIKVGVMKDLLMRKFIDWPELSVLLLQTGDDELVEGNDWNDTFWGVCRGRGENHLGKCLMEIRSALVELCQ